MEQNEAAQKLDQKGLSLFLELLNKNHPRIGPLLRAIMNYSENGKDLAAYVFHLSQAILQLKILEQNCREWKRFCYAEKKWWGFGAELSKQITLLNQHEINAFEIRKQLEEKRVLPQIRLDDQRMHQLINRCCSSVTKGADGLSSPMNGDLELKFAFTHHADPDKEGVEPLDPKKFFREVAYGGDDQK